MILMRKKQTNTPLKKILKFLKFYLRPLNKKEVKIITSNFLYPSTPKRLNLYQCQILVYILPFSNTFLQSTRYFHKLKLLN